MRSKIENKKSKILSPPPLILASASPRRAELLRRGKIAFTVRVPDFKEPHRKPAGILVEEWPGHLARLKALALQGQIKNRKSKIKNGTTLIILAADTIVVLEKRIINKPRDRGHARRILLTLNHRRHAVITGVCLIWGEGVRVFSARAVCRLDMTAGELEGYLASGLWKGKAGAYGIQDSQDSFVKLISGERSTVVGLPMKVLRRELAALMRGRS